MRKHPVDQIYGQRLCLQLQLQPYSLLLNIPPAPGGKRPAVAQWLQPSEHLFHSLVIAPSGKKTEKNPKTTNTKTSQSCFSKDTLAWTLPPATPPNDGSCKGIRRKKVRLEQISSIKESAWEDICLHQSTKDKLGIQILLKTRVCPAGQNLPHIYLQSWEETMEVRPSLLPTVSACSKSKWPRFRSHVSWPMLYTGICNQSLNILHSLRSFSNPL